MLETTPEIHLNLHDVKTQFGLEEIRDDEQFFTEWMYDLPSLTEEEKKQLDRVKASFLNLAEYPMLEDAVKMVVLSPLLNLAGFYLPPFRITTQQQVQISDEDHGIIVKGKIDILVVKNKLWVLVIESKALGFSLEVGMAQLLAYMLANNNDKPTFGIVTNGREFQFIKLIKEQNLKYALSDSFDLRDRGNKLYTVLSVFKRLALILSE